MLLPPKSKRLTGRLAKSNHPDKLGEDSMQAKINHAYEILSDPAKRKRYDETGQDSDKEHDQKLQAFLSQTFLPLIEQVPNPENFDLMDRMEQCIKAILEDNSKAIDSAEKRLNKFDKV